MPEDIPPPRIMRPRDLVGLTIPPRRWLVPEWMPWGSVTGLYGAGGLGKSLVAQQLQTSAAIEAPWLGMQVSRVRTLAMYCEDSDDELWRRQADINKALGCDFGDLEAMAWMPRLGEENLLVTYGRDGRAKCSPLHGRLIEAARDHKAELVIVDTVADTFGGNENDRGQVRQYVSFALGSIAKTIGGSVLCLAHPSRSGMSNGDGGSGSTGWDAAFRSRLYLSEVEAGPGVAVDPNARMLSRKKANYAARSAALELVWSNGVLCRARDCHEEVNTTRPPCVDVFLALLDTLFRQERFVSHKNRAGNFAPKTFAAQPRSARHGYLRGDFEAAMETLFANKSIQIEAYGRTSDQRFRIARHERVET